MNDCLSAYVTNIPKSHIKWDFLFFVEINLNNVTVEELPYII